MRFDPYAPHGWLTVALQAACPRRFAERLVRRPLQPEAWGRLPLRSRHESSLPVPKPDGQISVNSPGYESWNHIQQEATN